MPTKIAVVGNCQANPLGNVLSVMTDDVQVTKTAIVHLLNSGQEGEYAPAFEDADVILAQRVADTYPCSFVRSAELKAKYGGKVVTWPNLYYAGYNPELMYIRQPSGKPLPGPLGDYHVRTILHAWQAGLKVERCVGLINDYDYNAGAYGQIPARSLEDLRGRESETDVQISDFIEERVGRQRLFFTFNHPTAALLIHVAYLLLRRLELAVVRPIDADIAGEPLNQFIAPLNCYSSKALKVTFTYSAAYKGLDLIISNAGKVGSGKRRVFSASEIVEIFFKQYDSSPPRVPPATSIGAADALGP